VLRGPYALFPRSPIIFVRAMKSIAFGCAVLPLGGCAVGVGLIFAALMRSESYSPDIAASLFSRAMLGFALVESFMFIILAALGLIFVF
jgi:F0F1-type ATP synthase membrane subunit c/vacuolar-type H+-ATPase subunit K